MVFVEAGPVPEPAARDVVPGSGVASGFAVLSLERPMFVLAGLSVAPGSSNATVGEALVAEEGMFCY